ncbi:hypothetical protein HYW21_04275 [Candidatus Woesearchaeota archaeon]|nr:hypothetical protein [Candidatus Woesearchaeota archaeon]
MNIQEILQRLTRQYPTGIITLSNLMQVCKVKQSTAYHLLRRLQQSGSVVKKAKGIYKISSKKREIILSEEVKAIDNLLKAEKLQPFCFTAIAILHVYLPSVPKFKIFHLYVEKGLGKKIGKLIEEQLGITTLIAPTTKEILLLKEKMHLTMIILIREYTSLYSRRGAYEEAVIDLLHEKERGTLPFYALDTKSLLERLLREDLLNISYLMNYAKTKNLDTMIKSLIRRDLSKNK